MTLSEPLVAAPDAAVLYHEVQQFLSHQMRSMDEGRVDEWVSSFAEDGVFAANGHPEPQYGHAAIRAGAENAVRTLAEQGLIRRHWLGMLEVEERLDGTILAQTYALIISTPIGGQAGVHIHCTCTDVLVRQHGRLVVQHRQVYRDDIPKA